MEYNISETMGIIPDTGSSKRALDDASNPPHVKVVKLTRPEPFHGSSLVVQELQASGNICTNVPMDTVPVKVENSYNNNNNNPLWMEPLQELPVMPLIWAQSRQEVCESFDWFRSYQGGVYFVNNVTKGYLLSGFPAKRDGFFQQGKLIISHGGGKAESLQTLKGQTKLRLADDQKAEDKSVRSLLNNYRKRIPLVLLIDDRYALFPYNLAKRNITYAVLGVYNITHAWAERETTKSGQQHVRFKFTFQWCEEQGQPWWHLGKNEPKPPVVFPGNQGFHESFENDNARTTESDYEDMVISEDEEAIPPFGEITATPKTSRRLPVKKSEFLLSERTPGLADRSCSHCGMRSPLVFSIGWGCLNAPCPLFWTIPDAGGVSFPDELTYLEDFIKLRPFTPLDVGFRNILPPQPVTNPSDKITTVQAFTRGMHCVKCGRLSCRFKWQQWECANCGDVLAVSGIVRRAAELKSISTGVVFQCNLLGKDTGIIRRPTESFGSGGSAGHIQTFLLPEGRGRIHHIQHNSSGPLERIDALFEEYQGQASDGTLQFRRWPLRSHKLRGSLLTNYFSQNCGEPYHYVGGTANTVTWEQAPSAVIKARDFIKERTTQALQKHLNFNEVLSAAYMEKQKMSFHTDDEKGLGDVVAGLSLGSPALMHFRRRNIKHGPERKTCLTVVLRHGDVLVMDGAGVQQHYEHMVEPTNFRIAATARYIDPNRK
ncbi:hypothetical protein BDP27DRAFT_1402166 [Rhodocollybia butyracea]|uniref:Alpha-ketoglutarate-dependent dioxygenase AlkB-like domain-containing protein n=1 Tax=Rhodocollybia butyracea TaxID=206335 RepID=A0A9P5PVI5_9AGAR|nr:hypothetical protein BDP27DRAFT_1402166 [Rhodocollybia butyracea]